MVRGCRSVLSGVLAACVLAGCAGSNATPAPTPSPSGGTPAASPGGFSLTSSDLAAGRWPSTDTCDGADGVPDLHWSAGPPGTKSFALQLFDPDAPHGGFTRWMLANEGSELRQPTPGTGVSGKNDFGHEGYNGPCPPEGSTHRYIFTVYAIDATVALLPLYSHTDFQRAIQGRILAQATLTATYGR
ncbi:MAG: YbhB/YbcL family Raf kinase inhibitor-like protein [Chloroflexi bacterium]|nr:MAG: YbhB/YbcL family Raf kinase inhibitor-like protein [Chloroflexota bacterium]